MAVKKPVSFSEDERDQKILQFANTKFSFSVYVKELIEKDMESEKDKKKSSKKNIAFDF
jgi:hypothetical protein